MKTIVVAGIGTGIGKTLVSAIIVEALEADYWKPVQAGKDRGTDSEQVRELITNTKTFFHPEVYCLRKPASPYEGATIEGIIIDIKKLKLPETNNYLVVETAGGLMVPLTEKDLNIDMIKLWDAPVILVSQHYLGSINHTLLSCHALKSYGITLGGIIFNGEQNEAREKFILDYTGADCIARVSRQKRVNHVVIKNCAGDWKEKLITIASS